LSIKWSKKLWLTAVAVLLVLTTASLMYFSFITSSNEARVQEDELQVIIDDIATQTKEQIATGDGTEDVDGFYNEKIADLDDDEAKARLYMSQAEVFMEINAFEEALNPAVKAKNLLKDSSSEFLIDSFLLLAVLYNEVDSWGTSAEYYRKVADLMDSVDSYKGLNKQEYIDKAVEIEANIT